MTISFAADTVDDLLHDVMEHLLTNGDRVAPSRGEIMESRGVTLELTNPRARLSRSLERGRAFSALGEFCWYLAGANDIKHVEYYIKGYADGLLELRGAYGPRLFGPNLESSQIFRVIRQLRKNPATRQAVIQLFDRDDLGNNPLDIPCTCTLQFFDRDGSIDLITHMRSNDAHRGLPHDVFAFTMIQEIVARSLGRNLGTYVHMVGSLHIYTSVENDVRSYLAEGALLAEPMPEMPAGDPWPAIIEFVSREASIREDIAAPTLDQLGESYWDELALMLLGWRAVKRKDLERISAVRAKLKDSHLHLYLSDREFQIESENREK